MAAQLLFPSFLGSEYTTALPAHDAEDSLSVRWTAMVAATDSCMYFLQDYVKAAAQQGSVSPNPATALCVVYSAAALVYKLRLDEHITSPPPAGPVKDCVADTHAAARVGGGSSSATFAFQPGVAPLQVGPAPATAVAETATAAAAENSSTTKRAAAVIAAVVEVCLIGSRAQYALWRRTLSGTAMGLPHLGTVLRAYAAAHLRVLSTPNAASRCLALLARVVYNSGGGSDNGIDSETQRPDGPENARAAVDPIPPAHAVVARTEDGAGSLHTRLTIAHATYLNVARLGHKPADGLRLLLEHPLFICDAVLDGVMLADYIRYFTEGAILLAELGRYAEAAECIYNVTALDEQQCFGALLRSQQESWHSDKPAKEARRYERARMLQHSASRWGVEAEVEVPRPPTVLERWATQRLPDGLLRASTNPQHNPSRSRFVPSLPEVQLAMKLYLHACKMGIVLAILGFGGSLHSSSSSGNRNRRDGAAYLRATHIDEDVMLQAGTKLNSAALEPYVRLWHCAAQRDMAGLWQRVGTGRSAFVADGLGALVEQAALRLPRFIVLDMAAVYNTVSLHQLVLATNADRRHTMATAATPEEQAAAAQRRVDMNERQDALQLLMAMQEEGQLVVRLSYRAAASEGENRNGNEEAEKLWVVEWMLPSMLSANAHSVFMAGRNSYGNSCVSITSGISTVGTCAPSATSAAVLSSLRRADWLRAHVIAAEKDVKSWTLSIHATTEHHEEIRKEVPQYEGRGPR